MRNLDALGPCVELIKGEVPAPYFNPYKVEYIEALIRIINKIRFSRNGMKYNQIKVYFNNRNSMYSPSYFWIDEATEKRGGIFNDYFWVWDVSEDKPKCSELVFTRNIAYIEWTGKTEVIE